MPLFSGDFVQLPTVQPGQELVLVLFGHLDSNGNPTQTYYIDPKANADGMQHAVAFFPVNSRYIIVAWENTPGEGTYGSGDADFNDTIIVVDVGQTNANYLKDAQLDPAEVKHADRPSPGFGPRACRRAASSEGERNVMNGNRMRRCRANHRRDRLARRGTAAAEFALCLPLLVVLLMGAMETCNLLYLRTRMNSVAYEAARRRPVRRRPARRQPRRPASPPTAPACCRSLAYKACSPTTSRSSIQPRGTPRSSPPRFRRTWSKVQITAPLSQNCFTNLVLSGSQNLTAQATLIME